MKYCIVGLMALLSVAACEPPRTKRPPHMPLPASEDAGSVVPTAAAASAFAAPRLRWSGRPNGEAWTQASLAALKTHGAALPQSTPADVDEWCPAYRNAGPAQRRAFWAGFVSALSKHESTYRADAVGGGGKWFGLTQIAPSTARLYGCRARSGAALKNGSENVSCAIRIMSRTVTRDGVISRGGRGVAADWGPMHSSAKRNEMKGWLRSQPFCTSVQSS